MSEGKRRAFVNARLLDPLSATDQPGALLVDGDVIADVAHDLFADGVPEGIEVVDCAGHCLCPGLIDMRAFLGEPGAEHKETLATASHAAAAGGITTLVAMPDTEPVIDDIALVEYIGRRARDTAIINILPMAAVTKGLRGAEMTEIGMLAEAGAVGLTDGQRAVADPALMRRALSYASHFGLLIMQHAEDERLVGAGCMNEGEVATRLGLPGIPAAAETTMVERDIRLVELTGGRYHVASVSTADAVASIGAAKERGAGVSCAAAPTHFALNDTAVGDYRSFAKTSPPLRGEEDRRALVEGIASSHTPQDQEEKRLPFAQAAYGVAGLETLLPLALELYHNAHLPLLDVLHTMTAAPAALLGLDVGCLRRGAPADLVVFDIDAPWRVDADRFRSKSKNSPFDGRPVQGRALTTVVAGATVYVLDGSA